MPYDVQTGIWLQDVEDEDVLNHEVQIMMDDFTYPIINISIHDQAVNKKS